MKATCHLLLCITLTSTHHTRRNFEFFACRTDRSRYVFSGECDMTKLQLKIKCLSLELADNNDRVIGVELHPQNIVHKNNIYETEMEKQQRNEEKKSI